MSSAIMGNHIRSSLFIPVMVFLALSILSNTACQHLGEGYQERSPVHDIKRIAVMDFRPATYRGGEAVDAPSDPLLLERSYYMTSTLFEAMNGLKGYELIGPEMTREAKSRIDSSGSGLDNTQIAGMVAREFQADAVVAGYLYRWKAREGSDYAINSPASVFFDLFLISSDDGAVLWRGRFDKTQRSLNENLLDIRTFFKGKGKWMTAEDLAALGLKDLVDEMFLFMEKGKGADN